MSYFPPIIDSITKEQIDFNFLDPIDLEIQSDKLAHALKVRCRFTNHVFSEKPVAGMIALGSEYQIDDRGVNRQFSRERYEYSKQLPAMVRGLVSPPTAYLEQNAKGDTWHTLYHVANSITGTYSPAVNYHVWISVRRRNRGQNFGADIEMIVETAYPGILTAGPNLRGKRPNLLGRARLATIATNTYFGKPTRTRK